MVVEPNVGLEIIKGVGKVVVQELHEILELVSCDHFGDNIQGDPKKMSHSVLQLKSVVGVQSYFSMGVLESEFRARSN